jgi:hypothetical protein
MMEASEMNKVMVALIMTGGLLLVGAGCSKESKPSGDGAAASGDKIGVQECDDYIAKYSACISKMPAAAKGPAEQGFKTMKDAWKQAASTPAGKDGLRTGCKQALDALAQNPMCK